MVATCRFKTDDMSGDAAKRRALYKKSDKYRMSRIRHAKEYQKRNIDRYRIYQRAYRMKKRIEGALYGFVCEAKMKKAVDAIFSVVEHEIQLDREFRKKLV